MKNALRLLAAFVGTASFVFAAPGDFQVVGVYDENTNQANTINAYAVFGAGTGSPANTASNVIGSADFPAWQTALIGAASAGMGGVVNFDNGGVTTVATTTALSGSTTLATFTFSGGATLSSNQTAYTPLSAGSAAGSNLSDSLPGSLVFFGSVTGGTGVTISVSTPSMAPQLETFGITMLSRTSRDYGTVTATATFGDFSTVSATSAVGPGAGLDDTFFGFDAKGKGISSITFTWSGTPTLLAFDDVGFTLAIPEPSAFGLVAGLFSLGLVLNRRRRI